MEISIIQIGNSKGIRLAKTILERYDITDKVELIFKEGFLILKPVKKPRDGWDEAFKKMAERGDDELLIDDVFEDENWEL
ncbi:AbrB/MazE/SpoVT family DNA-binding domain-containing protein [Phaeodactylibacter sp.]|jgi:antitoxin MazE|uniref:AbrB/MazE/SpoVT family DNA-binding domain-containing protein n=1 Tax=Phaeodactylibacter sp. TaxID=1940289 RepID=UPI0025F281C4|nr:AbrB/MazE/SpoVT family DNA-binding domain-containing protein [Phaeodactylibacter sp.]MCI4650696.1 AbrB/MazE/SpoVT family DNA-binding domain-containing protein [Phaeodactylibacter sp.]MCI5089926.1 AbrB/MazE/SpoVT family DNA-binding domain-containing protein [Phaeodactylibacter sp.]